MHLTRLTRRILCCLAAILLAAAAAGCGIKGPLLPPPKDMPKKPVTQHNLPPKDTASAKKQTPAPDSTDKESGEDKDVPIGILPAKRKPATN